MHKRLAYKPYIIYSLNEYKNYFLIQLYKLCQSFFVFKNNFFLILRHFFGIFFNLCYTCNGE